MIENFFPLMDIKIKYVHILTKTKQRSKLCDSKQIFSNNKKFIRLDILAINFEYLCKN